MVAIKIQGFSNLINCIMMVSLMLGSVQLVYMSTSLNLGKSGALNGKTNFSFNDSLKYKYKFAQSSIFLQYIIVLGKSRTLSATAVTNEENICSMDTNSFTIYMIFGFSGEIETMHQFIVQANNVSYFSPQLCCSSCS